LKDFASALPANSPVQIEPLLDALKLESIHSLSGHLTLEGSKARVQGAVLGDVTPGTLFDVWTTAQQAPASLAFVSPDLISYNETQFNLSAFYDLLKRALRRRFAPNSSKGSVEMMEGFAASRIGMPLPDALALFSGEFASIQSNPSMDPLKAVYYVGIRNKQDTLKLLRYTFGEKLGSERSEGDAHFRQSLTRWQPEQHRSRAVEFLSPRYNTDLRSRSSAVKPSVNFSPPARPQMPPRHRHCLQRSRPPRAIPRLGRRTRFRKFQKIDYQALKARWIEKQKKSPERSARKDSSDTPQSTAPQIPIGC